MTSIRALGDAIPAIKSRLADTWGTVWPAPGARVRIADEVPAGWFVVAGPPLITVTDDGGPVIWPVMGQPTIRITAYANGKQTAKHIRAVAMGAVMNTPIPGVGNLHSTGIGYTEARDDDTGADVASFTVRASVLTQVVTI
jgi:hypothetical protein